MNRNEKGISAKDATRNLTNDQTMNNNNPNSNNFQFNSRREMLGRTNLSNIMVDAPTIPFPNQPDTVCYECQKHAEINGYRFRLVPICFDCRTEREIEITRNSFERRNKR